MSETGIDLAWDRPNIAAIKATGAHWVARYLSHDPTKNITSGEVHGYAAAGLGTVVVWETTTGRARQGHAAGVADAQAAEQQRAAVGLPADMVIHFAVDEDTTWAAVAAYFAGAATVLTQHRVGVYGGIRVIDGAAAAGYRYLWQASAWSAGRWSMHATIRQTGGTALHGTADYDLAMTADYGQHPRPTAPKPPAPVPVPAPHPTYAEGDMLTYLPPIEANHDTDIPVEPAGTPAAPKGGAKNGPLWLMVAPQGADGEVTFILHTAHGWATPATYPATVVGNKIGIALPTDGTVDKVRIHPTVPVIGYLVGRQLP